MFHRSSTALILLLSLVVASNHAFGDHHEAGQVEAGLKKFYSQLSSGEFKEAMGHIAIGASGYVATGELIVIDSEEVRARIVGMLESGEDRGAEMQLRPSDINVTGHDGTYVATYTVNSKVKPAGEDEAKESTTRGSMVWTNADDGLKIVHWHVSEAVPDDQ